MPQLLVFISILLFLIDLGSDGRVGKPGFSQSELGICSLPLHAPNFVIKRGTACKQNDSNFRELPKTVVPLRKFPETLNSFESLDLCQICRAPPLFS